MTPKTSWETPARPLAKGIGEAVAARTILRRKDDGSLETWSDVAYRVAVGNAMLSPPDSAFEFEILHKHLREASVLLSGRHLQHGDATQPSRNIEVFTNCSTSASTFILFYLLLNGSGVGTCYDDDMMQVDWSRNLPYVIPVIRADHPDVLSGEIGDEFVNPAFPDGVGDAAKMATEVFEVQDSREGWAKALEKIEYMTWRGDKAQSVLLLEFSHVRERGAPIKGMQNRPASGPGPLMEAIKAIAALKGAGMAPWLATMHADHHVANCVLVGGARRAARMATKTWRDHSVFEFISVKKGGGLWSSNNSVTVDEEFWRHVKNAMNGMHSHDPHQDQEQEHAFAVFEAICRSSYLDGTGEPGLINVERLTQKDDGIEALFDGNYAESERFKLDEATKEMTASIARAFAGKRFKMITNPCGEIALMMLGAYCTIADVAPYHAGQLDTSGRVPFEMLQRQAAEWDDNAEQAFRAATRALIRVNTMNALYGKEVKRTNRIGVGFTGLHEYAWARFKLGWKDLVDEEKSIEFWRVMGRFSNAVVDEAIKYSAKLGVPAPHTALTVKPAGTTSKLFNLSEGAHLAAMREYLRWVQFRSDDPLIEQYRSRGYPVRDDLKTYSGTTIVGFPTIPEICKLGMGDKLVIAPEATLSEQYAYLRLLEKWWIDGCEEDADYPGQFDLGHGYGNQVSYTAKFDMKKVSFAEFRQTLADGQSTIKCCSVMPEGDTSAYEYLPEEPVSAERFREIVMGITDPSMQEEVGYEHLACGTGGCPIEYNDEAA